MKPTKFWLLLFGALLLGSLALCLAFSASYSSGHTANIYVDGVLVQSVDLNAPEQVRDFTVTGRVGDCVIRVENGAIRMLKADCPDQICVRQGFIRNSVMPIVCMPNRLIIKIEDPCDEDPGYDAITQ